MLFKFSERLLDDLKNALGALRLEMEGKENIKKLEAAVITCIQYLTRLRKFFKENKPTEEPDLIRFFKTVKPQFKVRLIFYQFILETEKNKPAVDIDALTSYYLDQRKPLFHFFESNHDFYRYIGASDPTSMNSISCPAYSISIFRPMKASWTATRNLQPVMTVKQHD